jgi:hypothetical protein
MLEPDVLSARSAEIPSADFVFLELAIERSQFDAERLRRSREIILHGSPCFFQETFPGRACEKANESEAFFTNDGRGTG